MALKQSFGLPLAIVLLASLGVAEAQTVSSRLAGDWRSSPAVALSASKAPATQSEADLGAAPTGERLDRMLLLLTPSTAQQQALTAELGNLQNSSTPIYHQWLTAAAFADAYGNSAADVAAVSAWLQSQGLQVAPLPAGRGWIEFSGTVAQVEMAFETQIDSVATPGGTRAVLVSDISVPAALQPLVGGLVSLDGALSTADLTTPVPLSVSASDLAAKTSLNNAEALTPQLAAQLIHLDAVQSSGIDGKGQTIAIAARSNVNSSDVAAFRAAFGLPASVLQVALNGPDPGLSGDQAEATLAASWAGAAAPGATILLVPAETTSATDGVDLSLAAIIDQAMAHTVAVGFSSCESGLGTAHQAFYSALYQQAAAEGIAVVAAAGDSGSSACHLAGSSTPVSSGYGVSALASTAWNTAVGVAGFGAGGPAAGSSALAAWSPASTADPAYASGGGSSALHAGPLWQPVPAKLPSGMNQTGTPNRLLPDLSLPTALDSGVNHGLAFCLSGSTSAAGCTLVRSGGSAAAASVFAGIAALVDEKYGAQGNLAPSLYKVSTQSGVFNDVAQGNAQLKCAAGSPDCGSTGEIGYTAASGYDLTTGLGVPNAQSLVANWATPNASGTGAVSISLSVSPTETNSTYNPAASVTLTATVLSQTGGSAPTGTVTFYDTTTSLSLSPPETLNSNGTASVTLEGVFAPGGNEMVAQYSGDSNYAAVTSTPPVNINTQASTTSLVVTTSTSTVAPGQSISVTVTLTVGSPPAGTVNPAGVVTLNLDGGAETYTAAMVTSGGVTTASFPAVVIPANSTLLTHTLQAIYPTNTDYTGSTSPQISLNVTASTPMVTLTPATTTPLPGASLQLTADITPPYSGETPPTGTVTFTLDGANVGSATISAQAPSSIATLTITAPTTGTHTLQATYSGDGYYLTQSSSQVTITVSKTPTTTGVTPATTTVTSGNSVQVTATITPTSYGSTLPSGTVTFSVDGSVAGTQTVTQGSPSTAVLTLTGLTSGPHNVQAVYSGDTYYAGSSGSSATITVSKTTTNMSLLPVTTSPSAGSTLQVTATVTPTTYGTTQPSGTVTYTLDGSVVATGNLNQGSPSTSTVTFTVPSAGTHTLQATYSGDSYYASSTATAVQLNVSKSTPTVAVTAPTTTPATGSSLQLTASISPPATGGTSATGSVNFLVDGSPVGTALVSGGSPSTATLTITVPSIGTHSVTAVYSGDGNYNTATSSPLVLYVSKGSTTLTVAPATTSPLGGSTMVVTATISAAASGSIVPTGTVSFMLDGGSVGSGTVVGGTTASTTITVPTTGTHTLQASYSGDTNYNGSISPTVIFTVAKTPTTVVVVPSTNSPALGSTLPVTATVTPSSLGSTLPSGTITFTVDGVAAGIQAVTPGSPSTASFTLPALSPGSHSIAAIYSGDTYYAGATGTAVAVTVPKSPTAISISPATLTPSGGSSLAVSATILATTPGTTLPTGTVTYTLDGAAVATAAVIPGTPATSNVVLPSLTPGTHILQATYSGDNYYATSTAPAVNLTVSKSATSITISPSTLTPTAGGSMVVTAYIVSPSPATTFPSGTVSITQDGVTIGTGTVVPGSPSIANITIPLVSAGAHVLQGSYGGDTFYTGSNSPTVTIVAAKGTTTTTLTATPASLTAGTAETLTATIAPTNAVTGTLYTITGTVSFYDGKTLLGQVAVSNNTGVLTGLTLKDNISHSITAIYSGDTNWLGSASTVLPLEATTLPDYVVLTSNFATVQPGAAVVLTATVTPSTTPTSTGEQNPTGLVVFYDGTTIIGTSSLIPTALTNASTATLTIQTLPGGQDTVSAYYQGDLYYDAATSNLLTLTVESFTITPASTNPATNLNIVQGSAGSASFVITGEGGFNNEVQLVCAVPSQDNMTCTASPQQVVPTATVTFVVQTFTSASSPSTTTIVSRNGKGPQWPRAAGGAALAALLFFLLPFGKRARTFIRHTPRRWMILLLLLVGLGGTGIGCTSNNAVVTGGTPLGVATLKITGSAYVDNAVVSQSIYLTVNVVAP
jgi:subtilase family serine protease